MVASIGHHQKSGRGKCRNRRKKARNHTETDRDQADNRHPVEEIEGGQSVDPATLDWIEIGMLMFFWQAARTSHCRRWSPSSHCSGGATLATASRRR